MTTENTLSISTELEQKIHEAINDLVADGQKLTYENIRNATGSSFNSIKPALYSWKAMQEKHGKAEQQTDDEIEIDQDMVDLVVDEMKETIVEVIKTVTVKAKQRANEKVSILTNAQELAAESYEKESKATADYINSLEKQNLDLQTIDAERVKTLGAQTAELNEIAAVRNTLKKEVDAADSKAKELRANIDSLTTEKITFKANNDNLTSNVTELQTDLKKSKEDATQLNVSSNEQIKEISKLLGTATANKETIADLREQLDKTRDKEGENLNTIASLKATAEQLNKQLQATLAAEKQLKDKSEQLEKTATKSIPKTAAKATANAK